MVIGGNSHKVIWISANYTYNAENQIDHFIVSRKWKSLQDVRTKRGTDIGSDDHLILALFKLKLLPSERKFQTCARRFNIDNFEETEN
jgi:hypothetical protein